MSNYTKTVDFAAKDTLPTGNAGKIVKGTEINTEFANIATAVATKADLASPDFTGNPTAPTQALNDDSTKLANTAFVQQEINYAVTAGSEGLDGASFIQLLIYQRASSAPSTPTGGSFSFDTLFLDTPTGWTRNVPSGTDPVYISSATATTTGSTGTDDTLTWSAPVLAFQNGADGSGTDTKAANGYLYYGTSSSTAPVAPTESDTNSYDFSTGTFSTIKAGWSTIFTAPSLAEGQGFWAVDYSVLQDENGDKTYYFGSSAFRWLRFDGLVTFTNMTSSIANNVTSIDGGKIITNTLTADKIAAGTATVATGKSFSLAGTDTIGTAKGVGYFNSGASSTAGVLAVSSVTAGLGAATTVASAGVGAGNFYNATSTAYTTFRTVAAITTSVAAGEFDNLVSGSAGEIANATHDFYANGSGINGPFTGSHDALLAKNTAIQVGDIVVDAVVAVKKNVSNTITKVELSSSANQKGALGVFVLINNEHKPTSLCERVRTDNEVFSTIVPAYTQLLEENDVCIINALGEGQVNVCGEGGDIEVGDLIVTSSIAGKGMKQADDVIRGYTVAKAREAVTFANATEVKQIACIYLAG
jgi:hypothetical protein